MQVSRRIQRVNIVIVSAVLALPTASIPFAMLAQVTMEDLADAEFFGMILIHVGIICLFHVIPVVAFFRGVSWCRYVIGAIFSLYLLLWSFSWLAQHSIDRHGGFWTLWALVELLLLVATVVTFATPADRRSITPNPSA